MQEQVLSPGVQDGDHTDLGSQVFRIRCDREQSLCAGREQEMVKQARVLQSQDIQLVRYGEDNVEIAGVEEFALPCRQPTLTRLGLTFGAMAIATRVVGDAAVAALNGTISLELLKVNARSIQIQKAVALRA